MSTKPIAAPVTSEATSGWRTHAFQIAWAFGLAFYFLEYAARSAPAVMFQHLSVAFGINAIGVSAIPLTLRQVDPLIRELSQYRDLIQQRINFEEPNPCHNRPFC